MAAATYYSAVQKAYIAFYGRPADQVGLAYWADQLDKAKGNLATIINAFGTSAEAKALYASKSNLEAIDAVYVQIFGRSADAEGLKYYGAELAAGRMTLVDIAQRIADGAKGADATIITNKLTAAQAFTDAMDTSAEILAYSGDTAANTVRAWLGGVTADAASVTTATAAVAGALTGLIAAKASAGNPGQSYTLSTNVDTVAGGSADDSVLGTVDTVTATSNTFSVADAVSGGAGNDSLQLTVANITGATTITPTQLTGVETIRVINVDGTADDALTIDVTATAGVTRAEVSSSSSAVTFNNLSGPSVALVATSNTDTANFNVKTTALTGSADTVSLSLTSNAGNVFVNTNGAGFEAANLTVVGTNTGRVVGAAADVKTVTVSGSGTVTLDSANDFTAATTFNASAATGNITITTPATSTAVTGGSGNDSVTAGAGNDVIAAGAGNDSINGGTGNDNIDGGSGNDTVTFASGAVTENDTVVGGDGTDTLVLNGSASYSATTSTNDLKGVSGFETLRTSSADVTVNMLGLEAGNTITTFRVGAAGAVVQNGAIATVNGASTGGVTLGLKTNGTADTLAVTAGDATALTSSGLTLGATQYETINVNAVGANGSSVTLTTTNAGDGVTAATAATATSLKAMTITGSKNLTVTGSGVDTALATITASAFAGETLSLGGFGSTSAMTVAADGAYTLTVTTGTGADTITSGSGNDNITSGTGADSIISGAGNDTISTGDGANVVVAGAGNDVITGGADADNIDGGDGDDTISASTGNNTLVGGLGNDNITSTTGADSIVAGAGQDTVSSGTGNDIVDGAEGNDSIDGGAGSDSLSGGAGNDTLTGGTGDDTLLGGDGNDTLSLSSLTNGDSVDGGAGTDALTIDAVSSDSTPSGIANVEAVTITTIGGGATSITVDLSKVSGITSLTSTLDNNDTKTLTVKNLPSTVTSLTLADDDQLADSLALSYNSGPSALTLNMAGLSNTAASSITSLNAPLTISAKLNTGIDGKAQVYAGSDAQLNNLGGTGGFTTDATTITINTDSLAAAVTGTELTVGDITDNVLQSFSLTSGAYTDVSVSATSLTTSSSELTSVTISTGQASSVTVGEVVANSATAVSLGLTTGAQGSLTLGNADSSFAAAAVALNMNLGNQSSFANNTKSIVADSFSSVSIVAGAGVTATAPSLKVDATTGTISASTLTAGVGSALTVAIGDDTGAAKAKSIGAITVTGDGRVNLSVYDIATADTATATSMGTISASGMVSSLSIFNLDASDVAKRMTITAGAGNDTVLGGSANDTITGGAGNDSLVGNGGNDVFVFSVGDSNVVSSGANGTSTGQDTVTVVEADDVIRVNVTSSDATWNIADHVKIGTGGATTAADVATSFTSATLLIQTGATTGDNFDIAITKATAWTDEATAQGVVAVNLTGTAVADTLTTGAKNDTINGGAGNDTITGGAGNDSVTGGTGNDVFKFSASDTDGALTASTDTVTDFVSGADQLYFFATGVAGSSTNYSEVLTAAADIAAFITAADTALNGTVKYYFGVVGSDGYLAFDDDGTGITSIIKLAGVTNIDSTDIGGGA